jgi:hypothetical protein
VAFVGGNAGESQTDTVTGTLNDNDGNTLTPFDDATVNVGDVEIDKKQRLDESDPWTDGLLTVNPGDTIFYEITVTHSFVEAVNLIISDVLTGFVKYDTGTLAGLTTPPDTPVPVDDDLFFDGGQPFTLDIDTTLILTFAAIVLDNAPFGSDIINTATVTYGDISKSSEVRSKSSEVRAEVVPEPATIFFLGLGLVGIFALVRRKRRQRK